MFSSMLSFDTSPRAPASAIVARPELNFLGDGRAVAHDLERYRFPGVKLDDLHRRLGVGNLDAADFSYDIAADNIGLEGDAVLTHGVDDGAFVAAGLLAE